MTVGERIKEQRKNYGLTQKQLAEKMGVAEITIRQYELGKRIPSLDVLQNIAEAIEVSLRDLIPPNGESNEQLAEKSRWLSSEFDSCSDHELKELAVKIIHTLNRIFSQYQEIQGLVDFRVPNDRNREYDDIEVLHHCRTVTELSGDISQMANRMSMHIHQYAVDALLDDWESRKKTTLTDPSGDK